MMTARQPRIGLVPFYLKLYDDLMPARRAGFQPFLERVVAELTGRGLDVTCAPVCRIASEFGEAMSRLENQVDLVITLHLAYSPSLEALDVFRKSRLPLLLLDTTPHADFGMDVPADRIMLNHGVHGVMDFASMLNRVRRPFEIVAGSVDAPATFDRAAGMARAAAAVQRFRGMKTLRIGQAFRGMGDFSVDPAVLLASFNLSVDEIGMEALDQAAAAVADREVEDEIGRDRRQFDGHLDEATHRDATRVGLGLRRLVDGGGYGAFSVNFQSFDSRDRPAGAMPFLEISKSMARGLGYGGEGDVLTAALVAALSHGFGAASFTEIFCADWNGGTLFLSHMGEINPALAQGRPHVFAKKAFDGRSRDTAALTFAARPGPATFANLTPGPDDTFTLVTAPVEILAEDADRLDPSMRDTIRIWIRPRQPVARFLEAYSRAGGTHHSALVPGADAGSVAAFGRMLGIESVTLE